MDIRQRVFHLEYIKKEYYPRMIQNDQEALDYNIEFYTHVVAENENMNEDSQVFSSPHHIALVLADRNLFEIRENYLRKWGIYKNGRYCSVKDIFKKSVVPLINSHKRLPTINLQRYIDKSSIGSLYICL